MCPPSHSPTAEAHITVLQLTDLHLLAGEGERFLGLDTEQTLRQVLELARGSDSWPPHLILLSGDLAQQASPATYAKVRRLLLPLGIPCYCLPGNHDNVPLMEAELNQGNIHCQRQVRLGHWQFILLDSTIPGDAAGRLAEAEFALLERWLEQQPDVHTVVALHHQPVPVCSQWLDTMALPHNNRERLLNLLGRHRQARVVLWGHIHQEYDGHAGNLRLLATPSTSFQFTPKSEEFSIDYAAPGCRWLYLHADGKVETEVQRLAAIPESLERYSAGY